MILDPSTQLANTAPSEPGKIAKQPQPFSWLYLIRLTLIKTFTVAAEPGTSAFETIYVIDWIMNNARSNPGVSHEQADLKTRISTG